MKTILIIEDDADNHALFRDALRDSGYRPTLISDIPPIGFVATLNPALILLDYWAGSQLSRELCMHLKADPGTKHIPLILVSAHENGGHIAHNTIADAFVFKPCTIADFVRAIQQVLTKQQ